MKEIPLERFFTAMAEQIPIEIQLWEHRQKSKRTDGRMDGRYQVHYLPRFAVDKYLKNKFGPLLNIICMTLFPVYMMIMKWLEPLFTGMYICNYVVIVFIS